MFEAISSLIIWVNTTSCVFITDISADLNCLFCTFSKATSVILCHYNLGSDGFNCLMVKDEVTASWSEKLMFFPLKAVLKKGISNQLVQMWTLDLFMFRWKM